MKIDFFYYEKYDPVFIRPNRKGKKNSIPENVLSMSAFR